jgi:hypothetical protein
MIPRRKGDTPNPRGGIRHVIPSKGNYQEHTPCPIIDDNSSREELDGWKDSLGALGRSPSSSPSK